MFPSSLPVYRRYILDKFNIPGDDGVHSRRETVLEMLSPSMGYVDGATDYCLLVPFAEEFELKTESRCWLAYLYGLSYSCTTSIRIFLEFPSLDKINPKQLKDFWVKQKDSLWFNPDKKYIKNNDQVIPAIRSLYKQSRPRFKDYIVDLLNKGFDYAYKEICNHWKYFGPHGAYLFFDAIYGLCPELYSDPSALDWKNCGKTVSEGMAHMLYRDECVDTGEHDLALYNRVVDKLHNKSKQPLVIIESTLCAYRKLFKQSRYVGYYADRMLEECLATDGVLSSLGIDIWSYRENAIPDPLLGEKQGWSGIRKELTKVYLETGDLYA